MRKEHNYYVYILTNKHNTVLYIGVTNNLERRLYEHTQKRNEGFTAKYNVSKLVYYEHFQNIYDALTREKQMKAGNRKRKIQLITENNQLWKDLSAEWTPTSGIIEP